MKFLLAAINAKYIHSNPAIYSLRAYAGEELRQFVELAEYTINQPMQEILADIYVRKPDMIGFSCYIWNWRLVRELLGELPKLLPDTPVWLGGPEVTYDADRILRQYPQVTGVMVGEGEATFRELLAYYVRIFAEHAERECGQGDAGAECAGIQQGDVGAEDAGIQQGDVGAEDARIQQGDAGAECAGIQWEGLCMDCVDAEQRGLCNGMAETEQSDKCAMTPRSLQEISGLCLPAGYTSVREPIDLSTIPFLYYDLKPFENKIIYYESGRGCPFRCSYCLSSVEKRIRLRDINVVKRELRFFLDHKVKQVKFVDRTFNCSHAHTMAVWKYIQEHDNGVTNFHFEISADILREEEIALLNGFRPGLAQLEIGVQSVNPMTLQAIGRVTDLEKLEHTVAAIRSGGNVHQHLDLIAGLPYEDYESFRNSFNRVYRMRPEQLQLGFLKVLKGSGMWEQAAEYGIFYMEQPPYEVLYTKWLSYEEILRLKGIEEMVEIYYNSAQFTHTMPFLERAFPDPFSMYEALSFFYRQKGYATASPSRVRRYHILLEFAIEYDRKRQAAYRELLVFDMYLRENLKSRPEFALELTPYKEIVRSFYKIEEKERRRLPDYREYDWKQLMKMTHLEPFACPVWDTGQMAEQYENWDEAFKMHKEKRSLVLFDYQKRNPLNYEAEVQVFELTPIE